MLWVLLVILLVVALLGLPTTGWHSYGYAPSSVLTVVVIVLLVLLLTGRL